MSGTVRCRSTPQNFFSILVCLSQGVLLATRKIFPSYTSQCYTELSNNILYQLSLGQVSVTILVASSSLDMDYLNLSSTIFSSWSQSIQSMSHLYWSLLCPISTLLRISSPIATWGRHYWLSLYGLLEAWLSCNSYWVPFLKLEVLILLERLPYLLQVLCLLYLMRSILVHHSALCSILCY